MYMFTSLHVHCGDTFWLFAVDSDSYLNTVTSRDNLEHVKVIMLYF